MGWGTAEHEGFADEKRPDGAWSGGTRSALAYTPSVIFGSVCPSWPIT
jgi:hypothetical protein